LSGPLESHRASRCSSEASPPAREDEYSRRVMRPARGGDIHSLRPCPC
jgi:hypothetical protein